MICHWYKTTNNPSVQNYINNYHYYIIYIGVNLLKFFIQSYTVNNVHYQIENDVHELIIIKVWSRKKILQNMKTKYVGYNYTILIFICNIHFIIIYLYFCSYIYWNFDHSLKNNNLIIYRYFAEKHNFLQIVGKDIKCIQNLKHRLNIKIIIELTHNY